MNDPIMLDSRVSLPSQPTDGITVAVLLHGRGSDETDLQGLRPHLPSNWAVVTPRAPHAGRDWGYGPGWAWYRYIAEDRVVEEGLRTSLDLLDSFLDGLPGLLGVQPGRILLGGFSMLIAAVLNLRIRVEETE